MASHPVTKNNSSHGVPEEQLLLGGFFVHIGKYSEIMMKNLTFFCFMFLVDNLEKQKNMYYHSLQPKSLDSTPMDIILLDS